MLKADTDGEVVVTNRLLALDIDVEKLWNNGTATPDAQIDIEVGRYHLVKGDAASIQNNGTDLSASGTTDQTTQTASIEETYTPSASTIAGLPTPPEGYRWEEETGYTKTVILKDGVWTDSITVEKTDNNGNDYFYYITFSAHACIFLPNSLHYK